MPSPSTTVVPVPFMSPGETSVSSSTDPDASTLEIERFPPGNTSFNIATDGSTPPAIALPTFITEPGTPALPAAFPIKSMSPDFIMADGSTPPANAVVALITASGTPASLATVDAALINPEFIAAPMSPVFIRVAIELVTEPGTPALLAKPATPEINAFVGSCPLIVAIAALAIAGGIPSADNNPEAPDEIGFPPRIADFIIGVRTVGTCE